MISISMIEARLTRVRFQQAPGRGGSGKGMPPRLRSAQLLLPGCGRRSRRLSPSLQGGRSAVVIHMPFCEVMTEYVMTFCMIEGKT